MTQSIADYNRVFVLEKHAERRALAYLRGANFTHCLRINDIAPSIDIVDAKGNKITIRGSDIFDERTWKKFLSSTNQESDLCRLTDVVDGLVRQYRTWLLTEHTKRYQSISSESDLAWFEKVAGMVVVRRILEKKYEVYHCQGLQVFADPWIAVEMSTIMTLNAMAKEIAKAVHHIVKNPDDAQKLVEQVYDIHYNRIQNREQVLREVLPALPAGASMPLALLSGARDASDE
jgi:hypothetical protein